MIIITFYLLFSIIQNGQSIPSECFQNCYDQNDNFHGLGLMIRSTTGTCMPYQHSKYAISNGYMPKNKKLNFTSFCITWFAGRPTCPVSNGYYYCLPETCKELIRNEKCRVYSAISSTSTSLSLNPSLFHTSSNTVVVLYDSDYNCRFLYRDGDYVNSVKNNHFQYCTKYANLNVKQNTTIKNLYSNHNYQIFIIPLIGNHKVDSISRIKITTKFNKPQPPTNIKMLYSSPNSISIIYSNSSVDQTHGPSQAFLIRCLNCANNLVQSDIRVIRPVNFMNLQPCSKYCFELYSYNNGGRSEKVIRCFTTISSKSVDICIDPIDNSQSNSRFIKWRTNRHCPYKYKVQYWISKHNDSKETTTNTTSIKLNNLLINEVYCFSIYIQPNNESIKPYFMKESHFYTGDDVKPIISSFDFLIRLRLSFEMKISWNLSTVKRFDLFAYRLDLVTSDFEVTRLWKVINKNVCKQSDWMRENIWNKLGFYEIFDSSASTTIKLTNNINSGFSLVIRAFNYLKSHVIYDRYFNGDDLSWQTYRTVKGSNLRIKLPLNQTKIQNTNKNREKDVQDKWDKNLYETKT